MCIFDDDTPAPEPIPVTPAPVQKVQEEEEKADYKGQQARNKAKKRAALNSTTLTSGLGASEQANVSKKTLLGE